MRRKILHLTASAFLFGAPSLSSSSSSSSSSKNENENGAHVRILSPRPGDEPEPALRLYLDLEVTSQKIRGSPFDYELCTSGGGQAARCQSMMSSEIVDATLGEDLEAYPYHVLSAWLRHRSGSAVPGAVAQVLLWSSPDEALAALEAELTRRTWNARAGIATCLRSSNDAIAGPAGHTNAPPVSVKTMRQHMALARMQQAQRDIRCHGRREHGGQNRGDGDCGEHIRPKDRETARSANDAFVTKLLEAGFFKQKNNESSSSPFSSSSSSFSSSSATAAADDAAFHEGMLLRVALVTLSNAGYVHYTLNAIASLEANCGIVESLKTVCLDGACARRLLQARAAARAARRKKARARGEEQAKEDEGGEEETVFMVEDASGGVVPALSLIEGSSSSSSSSPSRSGGELPPLSEFSSYKEKAFNDIVRFKYVALHHFLTLPSSSSSSSSSSPFRYEVVLFTDGDVVFLRRGFLPHLLRTLAGDEESQPQEGSATSLSPSSAGLDVVTQCDLMGPVTGDDQACVTWLSEPKEDDSGGVGGGVGQEEGAGSGKWVDYLCSGFMAVANNARTRQLLNPSTVLSDPRYLPTIHDQEYFNLVIKAQVRYATLSPMLFPNGSPFNPQLGPAHTGPPLFPPPPPSPHIIHFNYFPGSTKVEAMLERGHWYDAAIAV